MAAAALSACGGGSAGDPAAAAVASAGAATASFTVEAASAPDASVSVMLAPTFHLAPVILDAPADVDVDGVGASALRSPHVQGVVSALAELPTRGLTVEALHQAGRAQALAAPRSSADGTAAPMATSGTVTTFTPAQIRVAYGLPALTAAGVVPTAAQAAQAGAGQTIYIVDAMHDANVVAELNAFNQKFGLPACTVKPLSAATTLPLAAPGANDGCVLSVAYATAQATLASTPPAVNAGWATEIALDVQWAHATAPLARIVLIEVPDASRDSLIGGIKLANAMGPGAVSMSFGGSEGNWTASVDAAFAGAGMSYLAATGDGGSAVSWPAVSPRVVAVGGTTLAWNGSAARAETVWSHTGGGVSLYTPTPAYQTNGVPGVGTLAHRGVADVSFNADPSTGQFVAIIPQGSTAVSWVSAGGTSLSTPQWAGLFAVANAVRAQAGKAALGAPHSVLYGQIGAVPGTYAAAFADVRSGANGTCATCGATAGYDLPTGLGTPNVTGLLVTLTGAAAPVAGPGVAALGVSGKAGTPLTFTVSATAPHAVAWTLDSAPAGMTVGVMGVVTWPKPVAGNYAVTVTARDTTTGLSGQGMATVKIDAAAPSAPVITAVALVGTVGKPLAGSFTVVDPANPAMSLSVNGIPPGMSLAYTGQAFAISWAAPVVGKYSLSISARNSAGLTAQATLPVTINAK